MIKSVYNTNKEIIQAIISLFGNIECDVTYSTGSFYAGLCHPTFKFDINPQVSGVIPADSKYIPVKDNTFNMTMYDPPFLTTTGPSLKSSDSNNIINKRFSVFSSEEKLHRYYIQTLQELYRITKNKGYIIFKCQDKVSSGKQYFSHYFIYNQAILSGFYPKDLFILEAKNRIVANWQTKNQQHARKYHSYFWIFQKKDKIINYV